MERLENEEVRELRDYRIRVIQFGILIFVSCVAKEKKKRRYKKFEQIQNDVVVLVNSRLTS